MWPYWPLEKEIRGFLHVSRDGSTKYLEEGPVGIPTALSGWFEAASASLPKMWLLTLRVSRAFTAASPPLCGFLVASL
jgi:hypothetical protein